MQNAILDHVESKRAQITANIDPDGKGLNGQFMTPAVIAKAMADMFPFPDSDTVRLLDPGAGAGSLTSAFLEKEYLMKIIKANISVQLHMNQTDSWRANLRR